MKHPTTTQEDNYAAARAAFDYPVTTHRTEGYNGEKVIAQYVAPTAVAWPLDEDGQRLCRCGHPYGWHAHRGACGEILCQCTEYDPGDGSLEARDAKRAGVLMEDNESLPCAIWALRVKYNHGPRREILRDKLVNDLHRRGISRTEIRRVLQVYGLL